MDHRSRAIAAARQHLACGPLFLDTETTGLDHSAEIVDICILDAAGQVLLDTLVRPARPIPPDATAVHGITNAMTAAAPAWPEVWPQVRSLLETHLVGIYNADYDLRLIAQTSAHHRLPAPRSQAFCIMRLYAEFFGDYNYQRLSYRWYKLEAAGRQCGIALPNSHRARADALLARLVFHHMAQADA